MATDSYAKRSRRKRSSGQGCMITLLVGGSLLAGLGYLLSEAARWLA